MVVLSSNMLKDWMIKSDTKGFHTPKAKKSATYYKVDQRVYFLVDNLESIFTHFLSKTDC